MPRAAPLMSGPAHPPLQGTYLAELLGIELGLRRLNTGVTTTYLQPIRRRSR
jgi:hypothetical protein